MRRIVAALALVVACGTLGRPPEPDRRLSVHTQGELFESTAGFRFAALPEPGASVVRVVVRYPVGSADDPPGKEGLAHLVEHLVFDIEVPRGDRVTSITAELGRISLGHNAATYPDHTDYETLVAPAALPQLLTLEAERLSVGCAGLTPEIFEREREVVAAELRQRLGPDGSEQYRAIVEQVYPPGHPYRRFHSVDSVAGLTLEDACAFLAGPYLRGAALVTASGAVDGATLRAAGTALSRSRKRDLTATPAAIAVAPAQPGTARVKVPIDEPLVLAAFPLPARSDRAYRILEMVWPVISVPVNGDANLFAWGHDAYTNVIGGDRAPILVVAVSLSSLSHVDDAIRSIRNGLDLAKHSLGDDGDSPQWRVRWQSVTETLLAGWESLSTRNELVADLLGEGAGTQLIVGRIDEASHAKPSEARELAATWLDPDRARYIVLEPSGAGGTTARTAFRGTGGEELGVAVDPAAADKPLPIPTTHLTIDTDHYRLDNGLELVMWAGGTSPLVHGRLVVRGGAADEPPQLTGIAQLTGAEVGPDSMEFSDRELATRVDDLIGVLGAELRSPGYELTDQAKRQIRGRLAVKEAREATSYSRELLAAIYGEGHPYARGSISEDSIDRISRDSAMAWARTHVVPKRSVMVVTGEFSPGLVEKIAHATLDQVSAGSDPEPPPGRPHPGDAMQVVRGVRAKATPNLHLDVAFAGPPGLDATYAKRLVLVAVLDSKLSALRGKDALTYGMSATYQPRQGGGLWLISGEVDAARAAEAATAIAKILDEVRTSPESYRAEFVLARQKVLEGMLAGVVDSRTIANRLAQMVAYDLPDNFYDHLAHDIAALTLADLGGFASAELTRDHQVFGAYGNQAAVDAAAGALTAWR